MQQARSWVGSLAVAVVLCATASGLRVALDSGVREVAMPGLLAPWLVGIGCLVMLSSLLALVVGRAWLWVGIVGFPVALLGGATLAGSAGPELGEALGQMAPQLNVMALAEGTRVLDAAAAFFWAGGMQRAGIGRLATYVPVLVIWGQVIAVGMQLLVPGALVFTLLALLPVVAARAAEGESWVFASVRGIPDHPVAWLLAIGIFGIASVAVMPVMAMVASGGDVDQVGRVLLMGEPLPVATRLAADLGSSLVGGLGLFLAASFVDRKEGATRSGASAADPANPWASS